MNTEEILSKDTALQVIDWLNGKKEKPENAEKFINSLYYLFIAKKQDENTHKRKERQQKRKMMSLSELLKENRELEQKRLQESNNSELLKHSQRMTETINTYLSQRNTNIISTEEDQEEYEITADKIARALRQAAKEQNKNISWSQMNIGTYLIYGIWLAKKDESLTKEQPTAGKYGPIFTSLYKIPKKIINNEKKENEEDRKNLEQIKNRNRLLYVLIVDTITTLTSKTTKQLTTEHTTKDSPWKKAQDQESDKKMKIKEIKEWFRKKTNFP